MKYLEKILIKNYALTLRKQTLQTKQLFPNVLLYLYREI